ncbi:hypothetical protein MKW94_026914, partial [Papaver nudicaule]|nr:hypothetical protein [Papaver nudicaule]
MTASGNTTFMMTKTNLEFQVWFVANDLRLKLQNRGLKKTYQKGKGSLAGGVQDLRTKLSGRMPHQAFADLQKSKPKELPKPTRKSDTVDVPMAEAKKPTASRKKSQQKVVDNELLNIKSVIFFMLLMCFVFPSPLVISH